MFASLNRLGGIRSSSAEKISHLRDLKRKVQPFNRFNEKISTRFWGEISHLSKRIKYVVFNKLNC